ncbi:MAG: sugar ABC transporter permease [Chloroflexi bacterium]|nr:sugar ABC transporter permease [Chloroflexota bacterium]
MATAQRVRSSVAAQSQLNFRQRLVKDFVRNRYIYLMLVPVVAYYVVFHYGPMYGALMAFQDFNVTKGIWGSPWIGFENFTTFFNSVYFTRLIRNTLAINIIELFFAFPAPIILALLLNEITSPAFKRTVQTITYLPHFVSLVVVIGMMVDFLARDGLVNNLIGAVGVAPIPFLQRADWYWWLFVGSGIWQGIGWGSIVYLAAITNIDPTLYEAATVDGANRWHQLRHITIPSIMPTIIIFLILRIGSMMSVGYEKTILMYNSMTYETADVINSYVYRKGVLNADYGFSAAVGLFNSVINFGLLLIANRLSKRVSEMGLF